MNPLTKTHKPTLRDTVIASYAEDVYSETSLTEEQQDEIITKLVETYDETFPKGIKALFVGSILVSFLWIAAIVEAIITGEPQLIPYYLLVGAGLHLIYFLTINDFYLFKNLSDTCKRLIMLATPPSQYKNKK
jgi:hypothetical protein